MCEPYFPGSHTWEQASSRVVLPVASPYRPSGHVLGQPASTEEAPVTFPYLPLGQTSKQEVWPVEGLYRPVAQLKQASDSRILPAEVP